VFRKFNKDEIGADTSFRITKQILVDEFDDPELLPLHGVCLLFALACIAFVACISLFLNPII
jgi:hypothetical protein